MTLFQHVVQKGFLTPVLGVICGLAATVIVGTRVISGVRQPEENTEGETLPQGTAPVSETPPAPMPEKPPFKSEVMTTALANPVKQTTIIETKNTGEKPSGSVAIVRRTTYIAFKGFEFQLFTGKYRCSLDFFDTYYFHYLGDGVTERGMQWFKFKTKNRVTDKGEIRFKLTGSRFSKLIYRVMVVETFEHFLPGNSPLEEEEEDNN